MDIGIIGCGFIGTTIASSLDLMDEISSINLVDISRDASVDLASSLKKARAFGIDQMNEFIGSSDLIVEAASQEAVAEFGALILEGGADLMILSVGALSDDNLWRRMRSIAMRGNARIFVPSGAICGIDGIGAASMADLGSVSLTVRKPPKGLSMPESLKEEILIFEGSALEAVRLFPKNVNVAATIAASGAGFQRTHVRIIADPAVERNTHSIEVRGRFGELRIEMVNLPSDTNPRTSYLAPLSALSMIRKIITGIYIGS